MLPRAYSGARLPGCTFPNAQTINTLKFASPELSRGSSGYPAESLATRKPVDEKQMSNIRTCTSSPKKSVTRPDPAHVSSPRICPTRGHSDLVSVGEGFSNVIRFKSWNSPSTADSRCDLIRTTRMEQTCNALSQKSLECAHLQSNVSLSDIDIRLRSLEEHKQEGASKMALFEGRLSAIERHVAFFQEFRQIQEQQRLDIKEEIANIKDVASDLEETLGCNSRSELQQGDSEKTGHRSLTGVPEDKNTLIHRMCVVECHIDMIASILKHIQCRFADLNGQVLECNWAGSKRSRFMRKSSKAKSVSSNTMSSSQEDCASSDVSGPDSLSRVYRHTSASRKDLAGFNGHVELPASVGMTDHQCQESALVEPELIQSRHQESVVVKHDRIKSEVMPGRWSQYYADKEVPLDDSNLTLQCPTIMEECDMQTD